MQDDGQEGIVDFKPAVILDKAQLPEFIHEIIHSRARGTDHSGQRLLGHSGKHRDGLVIHAITGQQQKRARQPLFAGVEKLIDQILLESDVPCQHESNKAVG